MSTPDTQAATAAQSRPKVDYYGAHYSNFATQLYAEVRRETYGEDMGQNSWITVDEQDRYIEWLGLGPDAHVLEVACGSGGPSLRLERCARGFGVCSDTEGEVPFLEVPHASCLFCRSADPRSRRL